MKKICPLLLLTMLFGKAFSQDCVSLGCAAAHTGLTTNGTLTPIQANNLGCYDPYKYTQIFWEFVYSPSGGDFTQTFTPTSGSDLSLNFVILDQGTTAPADVSCPINSAGWVEIACGDIDFPNMPVGPGLNGVTATTVAGHYYAIAIIDWQSTTDGTGDASYTFDTNTPQIGGVDVTAANCPGTLPVTLSSFTAKVNDCVVNLNWTAEQQTNFKNYVVQHSSDGLDFKNVATIAGTSIGNGHNFSYQQLSPGSGNNYYRLQMVDVDGKIQYSKIITLNTSCTRNLVLAYPNPVNNILRVNIPGLSSDITTARLYNSSGRLVYSGTMQSGTNSIDMSAFSKGIYLLNIKSSLETQNIKVIK